MEETPLEYPTGSKVEYSDLTYRLLGHTLDAATGQNLQQFAKAHVWSKLGIKSAQHIIRLTTASLSRRLPRLVLAPGICGQELFAVW